jgi:predicted dehydrogenase
MGDLRIGVIGLGFGEYHVRTITNLPGARLAAVADTVGDRVDRIASTYGAAGFHDATAMIDSGCVDALSICVSPAYREPILRRAAAAGLPLFIEKPWAANLEQGLRFRDLVAGIPVMTGFSFRFLPAFRRLAGLVAGELGSVRLANGEYAFRFLPPNDNWLWDPSNGNGLFNENSCHLFDAVCALAGTPVAVSAAGRPYAGSPSEDGAALVVEFESGAAAALTIGGIAAPAFRSFPRLDVITERGQARLSGRSHIWESLAWATDTDTEIHQAEYPAEELGTTRYTAALSHFMESVRTGTAPETGPAEGLCSVALAEAVYLAIRGRCRVVIGRYDA